MDDPIRGPGRRTRTTEVRASCVSIVFVAVAIVLAAPMPVRGFEERPPPRGEVPAEKALERAEEIKLQRERLRSKDPRERATAANRLGHLGAMEAVADLKELLDDESGEVKYFALAALVELDADGIAPDARRLLDSSEPNLKLVAAQALLTSKERDEETLKQVNLLLESPSSYLRQNAALVLGLCRVEDAVPSLEKMLSDPDPEVRFGSLSALGMIGSKRSARRVAELLEDPDPQIQIAALHALGEIDPRGYQPQLRKALESGPEQARSATLQGLARVQDDEALRVLRSAKNGHALLNYYHAPRTCSVLEHTRVPRRAIRWKTVREILEVVSRETGKRVEVSKEVPSDVLSATYGPNFQMLGIAPSAMSVLGSLTTSWFIDSGTSISFLAEEDQVRILTAAEAEAFWKDWKPKERRD